MNGPVPAAAVWRKVLGGLLALLGALYGLQMASPLRLNTDAIVFLFLGQSAAAGKGFLVHGQPTHFPAGYPAMLAGLDAAGLGASWAYIGLNCVFVAAAVWCSYRLYRQAFDFSGVMASALCVLVLLCHVLVKHLTLPISDTVFMGLAMMALLACQRAVRSWRWLPVAAGLVVIAVAVRTVGIALVPALGWACLPQGPEEGLRGHLLTLRGLWNTRRGVVVGGVAALVLAAAGGVRVIARTAYVREAGEVFQGHGGLVPGFIWISRSRLLEWAEVAINVPMAKLPAAAAAVLPFIGAAVLAVILGGFWLRRWRAGVVEVFLLAYLFILFCWPYYDARFLLPVVPLALGAMGLWFRRLPRAGRAILLSWTVCFVLGGTAALLYSTRLSLSGQRFPDLYGTAETKACYRVAFGQGTATDQADPDMLALLRAYEKRAAARH